MLAVGRLTDSNSIVGVFIPLTLDLARVEISMRAAGPQLALRPILTIGFIKSIS